MSELNAQALSNLDETSRKEIMQWVESENSKSKVQMCKQFFLLLFRLTPSPNTGVACSIRIVIITNHRQQLQPFTTLPTCVSRSASLVLLLPTLWTVTRSLVSSFFFCSVCLFCQLKCTNLLFCLQVSATALTDSLIPTSALSSCKYPQSPGLFLYTRKSFF